jgi:hypothetical protein
MPLQARAVRQADIIVTDDFPSRECKGCVAVALGVGVRGIRAASARYDVVGQARSPMVKAGESSHLAYLLHLRALGGHPNSGQRGLTRMEPGGELGSRRVYGKSIIRGEPDHPQPDASPGERADARVGGFRIGK